MSIAYASGHELHTWTVTRPGNLTRPNRLASWKMIRVINTDVIRSSVGAEKRLRVALLSKVTCTNLVRQSFRSLLVIKFSLTAEAMPRCTLRVPATTRPLMIGLIVLDQETRLNFDASIQIQTA